MVSFKEQSLQSGTLEGVGDSTESNHCDMIHNREQSLGGDSFEGVVIVGCFIRLPYRKFNSFIMFVMYEVGNLGIYKFWN